MSETVEIYRAMADHKKRLRQKYGVECPRCKEMRPKTNASILMPQQKCRVDGYIDGRPELTDEQWQEA